MCTKPEPTLDQNQIEALSSQLVAQTCPFVYVNQVSKSRLECSKDSFITQDRNDDFEGGQVESTFLWGHCDLTSGKF